MKPYAVTISTIGFFVMAVVGWASDVPVDVCAMRAAGGAAALYIMSRLVGRLVLSIMVDAVVSERSGSPKSGETR